MLALFVEYLYKNPPFFISTVVVIIFSICMHEYAHAYMALKQGDSTAADSGHLTLNPMIQMGPMSLLMIVFIGIAWGAVPVNPSRMRHKWSHALVAFAGPAMNLILAICFLILTVVIVHVAPDSSASEMFHLLMYQGAMLNIVLFIFNLLPIPILDGWTVFSYFIPAMDKVSQEARNALFFFIFIGFFFAGNYLFGFAHLVVETVVQATL